MTRVRNVFFGTTVELNALPAHAVPGTFFFNTTTKELYVLDINGRWYNTNGSASAAGGSDYHEGI
jgi:hypothetical protein